MSLSKVIPGNESKAAERWAMPEVHGTAGQGGNQPLMTANRLQQVQEEAYREAYEQGRKEGFEYGHREALESTRARLAQSVSLIDGIVESMSEPLAELDTEVEEELVALAMAVARQLVRREIKTNPGQVIATVREAVGALPVTERTIYVHLHPEDAVLVREVLAVHDGERSWSIIEDPVLSRGGCRVATDISRVDATVEGRLAAVIARVLGGERQGDGK